MSILMKLKSKYKYVCIYVCVYVCMYVEYVCMYLCMSAPIVPKASRAHRSPWPPGCKPWTIRDILTYVTLCVAYVTLMTVWGGVFYSKSTCAPCTKAGIINISFALSCVIRVIFF